MSPPITTEFYDGDDALYLRVEETVFQACPARLRYSSIFRTMLELPQTPGSEPDGRSRYRPIEIPFASAREFAHFMWAVHARAHAVVAFTRSIDSRDKVLKLLDIARMAHRFEFDDDAEWALGEAVRILKAIPGFAVGAVPHRLLEVTHLWGADSEGFRLAQELTKTALMRNAALHYVDLILALERLALPQLLGLAYYRLAMRGPGAWADTRFAAEHLRRLCNGYFSICALIWSIGDARADCAHQPTSTWNNLRGHIAAAPAASAPPDILGFLAAAPQAELNFYCASCGRNFTGESEALQRARSACAEDKLLDLFTIDHIPAAA